MTDGSAFESELQTRSGTACELCAATDALGVMVVPPALADGSAERCVYACATCSAQALGTAALDPTHWFCLREAIWSEVAAVQVVGYRILKRLQGEGWAQDLLGQVYLMEEVQEWADSGAGAQAATRL